MKIFLDDMRPCPEGWVLTKNVFDTLKFLEKEKIEAISLDHDLGDDLFCGYDVLLWIEKSVILYDYIPPKTILIHTSNPSARIKMELAVKRIERLMQEKDGN